MFLKNYFFSELSRMCSTVQLSRFLSVFDSSDILSYRFALVKNFFNFFIFLVCRSFATAYIGYHKFFCLSTLFLSFYNRRRRRDLNPRAAINDLLPFQGSPFNHLGTSPNALLIYQERHVHKPGLFVSGEGGIRTHAPLRTNGFQDRLVMTTSIPLRVLSALCELFCLAQCKEYSITTFRRCQHYFSNFFIFFKKTSASGKSSGVVTFILR